MGQLTSIPKGVHPDDYDFDHPNSLDFDEMYKCLTDLANGQETHAPNYCFKTHSRIPHEKISLKPNSIVIFEGILSFHDERIRDLLDLKIFIVCDLDIALARRIERDIKERGRDVREVLTRYNRFIKQGYEKFVRPQMKYADLIVPGGANNDSNLISRPELSHGPHPNCSSKAQNAKHAEAIDKHPGGRDKKSIDPSHALLLSW